METVWSFFKKLKIESLYNSAIPFLGIYMKKTEKKKKLQKITCTTMFIAAPFTMAKVQKQAKYPSTEKWTKMWCIFTMEYYSAIKRMKFYHL